MNLFGIGNVGTGIFFKMAAYEGAMVVDYQVVRNLVLILLAVVELIWI